MQAMGGDDPYAGIQQQFDAVAMLVTTFNEPHVVVLDEQSPASLRLFPRAGNDDKRRYSGTCLFGVGWRAYSAGECLNCGILSAKGARSPSQMNPAHPMNGNRRDEQAAHEVWPDVPQNGFDQGPASNRGDEQHDREQVVSGAEGVEA